MDLRHPVRTVQWAWQSAIENDLAPVEHACDLAPTSASSTGCELRRPRPGECTVVLFTQCWCAGELGLGTAANERDAVEAETAVITGPAGDACVYVSTRLLYRVARPNRQFFLDVAAQRMRGGLGHAVYEGRDAADLEAFDYEAAGALARVRGAITHGDAEDAARLVRMLRALATEIEGLGARRFAIATA
jgi:hypothetical protein